MESSFLNTSDAENGSHVFYGIALPKEFEAENCDIKDLVFTEKQDALSAVKKYKGSRFRCFNAYEEAVEYSQNGLDTDDLESGDKQSIDAEKAASSGFRAPLIPELSKFRKFIESGNIDEVNVRILSNPRYLVSCGDSPVILMEGPRYNAFHCAAKANRFQILQLILNTIKDSSFMKRLYPVDDETTTINRINHIVDLYLNTPDKAANDTPLHFATKFGSKECVQILLSEGCDTEKVNSQGKKAQNVICDRKGGSDTRKEIMSLFESRYYVPIMRDADGVTIGSPCLRFPEDETIKAVAGPMSPSLADSFYRDLRSPARRANLEELQIRLTDDHKGVERIARNMCKESRVNWKEYWPFLDSQIDLASIEGLSKLEQHLRNVYNELLKAETERNLVNNNNFVDLCEKLDFLRIDITSSDGTVALDEDDQLPDIFITAPTSPDISNIAYFVTGETFSKWDANAALALNDIHIDGCKYPYTKQWLKNISSDYQVTSFSSPSPTRKRLSSSVSSWDSFTPRK